MVRLHLALYGRPDSGGFWEQHCEKMLKEVGFELVFPAAWPSVFYHSGLGLLLAVYVDDFKMAGFKRVGVSLDQRLTWTRQLLWEDMLLASTSRSNHPSGERIIHSRMSLTSPFLIHQLRKPQPPLCRISMSTILTKA